MYFKIIIVALTLVIAIVFPFTAKLLAEDKKPTVAESAQKAVDIAAQSKAALEANNKKIAELEKKITDLESRLKDAVNTEFDKLNKASPDDKELYAKSASSNGEGDAVTCPPGRYFTYAKVRKDGSGEIGVHLRCSPLPQLKISK